MFVCIVVAFFPFPRENYLSKFLCAKIFFFLFIAMSIGFTFCFMFFFSLLSVVWSNLIRDPWLFLYNSRVLFCLIYTYDYFFLALFKLVTIIYAKKTHVIRLKGNRVFLVFTVFRELEKTVWRRSSVIFYCLFVFHFLRLLFSCISFFFHFQPSLLNLMIYFRQILSFLCIPFVPCSRLPIGYVYKYYPHFSCGNFSNVFLKRLDIS